ncbi:MAG: dienelactone hydrolase family protein, partial [Desulfobacterales bacterium]|nr:dienelactone hydrolase family protein [Desulfobacterales bacterium]
MQEREVDIRTGDGVMNTCVFHPDAAGPHPVIVFFMDSIGVREELFDMCRRIATVGYFVVLPNLFYRHARHLDFDADRLDDPAYGETRALWWSLVVGLSNEQVLGDFDAVLDFLSHEAAARPGKMGLVGHCMSGRFAFKLAAMHPDIVAAAASLYGTRLVTDQADSPHLLAGRIKGEMYFGCAEHDGYITREALAELQKVIDTTGINARIEWYPQAHHGFAFPGRRVYDKRSAERHW